MACKRDSSGSG